MLCCKDNWCEKCMIEQMLMDLKIHFSSKTGKKVHSGLYMGDGSLKGDCGYKIAGRNSSTYTRIECLINMCSKCKSHLIKRLNERKKREPRILKTVSLDSCECCGCDSYHKLFTIFEEIHYSCRTCGYIILKEV